MTDTNFTLLVTCDETTTTDLTLDYGDLLLLRAALQFARYAGYTISSWNLDIQLTSVQALLTNETTTVQNFLSQFPNLFTFSTIADLTAARQAFSNSVALYLSGSEFIRNRTNVVRLFNYDPAMAQAEADFRTTLSELSQSLNGPVVLTVDTNLTLPHLTGCVQLYV